MSEDSVIWMFLSILAICFTWHKIATGKKPAPSLDTTILIFKFDDQPINGFLDLTVDGRTSRFKLVDGKIT